MQKSITIFLVSASISLVLTVIGLILIVTNLDPSKLINVFYFYMDLFLLCSSLTFLVGFWVRRSFGARELTSSHFRISLRQSIWFAALVLACFVLLANNLFSIWNALLLALSLTFLESYFLFK